VLVARAFVITNSHPRFSEELLRPQQPEFRRRKAFYSLNRCAEEGFCIIFAKEALCGIEGAGKRLEAK